MTETKPDKPRKARRARQAASGTVDNRTQAALQDRDHARSGVRHYRAWVLGSAALLNGGGMAGLLAAESLTFEVKMAALGDFFVGLLLALFGAAASLRTYAAMLDDSEIRLGLAPEANRRKVAFADFCWRTASAFAMSFAFGAFLLGAIDLTRAVAREEGYVIEGGRLERARPELTPPRVPIPPSPGRP